MILRSKTGQSLVEIFTALGIGTLIIGGVTGAFLAIVKTNDLSAKNRNASITNDALLDSARSFAAGNWTALYALNKGAANRYYLINSAGTWAAQVGSESVIIGNATYTRSFYDDNVSRDGSGNIESVYSVPNDDPSTQKITIETSFPISGSNRVISSSFYVTRSDDFVLRQTDWSGGSGQEGPITQINNMFASAANIDFTSTPGSIVPIPTNLNYIYVADSSNNRIQKFDSSGTFIIKWGSAGSGDGQFQHPQGFVRDTASNLYVADTNNHRIQKFDTSGNFLLKWGSHGDDDGEFDQPRDVAVDSSNNIYVMDFLNDRVQKFSSSGTFITKWGSQGSGNGQLKDPEGIAVDISNNVYVADTKNDRIQKFDSDGNYILQWGSTGSGDGQFINPHGIGIDSSNNIYIADSGNKRIQKFNSSGTFLFKWGTDGVGDGQFKSPEDLVTDAFNYIYVVDSNRSDIQKFDSSGIYVLKWGSQGSGDGQFQAPTGIASSLTQCLGSSEECSLISSVFDTGVIGGAGLNTIMWQGSQITGSVSFKIASSNNSNGPWNYSNPINVSGPNVQIKIDPSLSNKRYVRYKLIMDSDQSNSPKVDDVIISVSR